MIAIKARYDGNSFIPLEPVSLPDDCNVIITLDIAIPVSHDTDGAETTNASTAFSVTGSVDVKRNCYTAGENAYADNEEAKSVAARILKKHIKAFEELAK